MKFRIYDFRGGSENTKHIYNDVEKLVETVQKMTQESEKQIEIVIIEDETPNNTFPNVTPVPTELEKILSYELEQG